MTTRLSAIAFTFDIAKLTQDFTGRQWVFDVIDRWLKESEERFFILTGEPGVGKSTIAARLTQIRDDIAAYHFCIAGRSDTIEPNHVLLSLAAQLIDYFPEYAEALANTIKPLRLSVNVEITIETIKDSEVRGVVINNLHTQNPQEALNVVLRRSLAALPNPPQQPVLLLIDSLDEAVTLRGDNNLVTLLAETNDLPPWVRFVFTTRPERRVLRYFERLKPYTLAAESQMNLDDIRQYIENRVGKEKMQARLQSSEVEPEAFVNRLSELSTGNFLYIKILLNDIESRRQTLDDLSALPRSLDEIYHGFLKRFTVTEWEDRYQPILGVLAVAQEPITEVQLAHFTGIGQGKIRQNLGVVRQFLDISDDGHRRGPFSVFHQSLRDYLLNEERNIDFWCEAKEQHQCIVNYYMVDDQSRHTKPASDRYLWHYLAYHLNGANRNSELRALLFNFDWLQAKLDATDVNALIADFDFLSNDSDLSLVQSDENLHLVQRAIQMSMHTLNQDKTQLAGQLLGRLLFSEHPDIQSLLEQAKQWKGASWLRPFISSLTTPNTALLRTLIGHSDYIRALVVMPDGKQAVSSSNDGTLKVWDIETGETLCTLQEQSGRVDALAVMPNGEQVLAAVGDGSLKIWDLKTGNILHSLQTYHTRPINAVAVTPDEQLAVSASSDGTLEIWNLARGELLEILKGHTQWVETVAITSKGDQVISGAADNLLQVWDLKSNEEPLTLRGHDHWIRAAVVIPGSQRAISASADQTLKVWDLETGEVLHTLQGHTRSVNSVAVIDQQRVISASDDHTLRIWDIETGTTLNILTGHTGDVRAVAVTPDGRKAISAAIDNTLKVWNLDSVDKQDDIQPEIMPLVTVVILPDGDRALSTISNLSKTRLNIWSLHDGAECHSLEKYGWSSSAFAVMPDGQKILAASSHQVNTMLQTMSLNEVFANVSKDALKFWDLKTGKELSTLADPAGGIQAIAVTPDGQIAVTASRDNTLRVWDLDNETELRILRNQEFWRIHTMAVTPDKRLVISAGSLENDLRVWDLQDGREIMVLKGHTDYVYEVASLPQQRAISASKDHTLKIWNLESAEALCTLTGHSHGVTAVAATPNGQRAVSVSDDCSLKVWDLENEKLIASFVVEVPLVDCAIAPNGKFIIAGDTSTRIHVLRLEDGL